MNDDICANIDIHMYKKLKIYISDNTAELYSNTNSFIEEIVSSDYSDEFIEVRCKVAFNDAKNVVRCELYNFLPKAELVKEHISNIVMYMLVDKKSIQNIDLSKLKQNSAVYKFFSQLVKSDYKQNTSVRTLFEFC